MTVIKCISKIEGLRGRTE